MKEEEKVHQARLRAQYEKEREKLTEFISREGKKYDNPAHQAQRKMKMKQLEKLIEIDLIEDETELVLKFPKPYSSFDSNERMITLQDVSFGWGDTGKKSSGTLVMHLILFYYIFRCCASFLGFVTTSSASLWLLLSVFYPVFHAFLSDYLLLYLLAI